MSRFCIIPSRVLDDERFSLTHIRVIAALGQHADKNGWCWPATTTLAERIKVSRQRISTCIRELKEWGYIEVTSRVRPADGGQTSNLYRVMFDIGAPVDAVTHAATLQPYVAPLQPHVAPPATSGSCTPPQPLEVAPPATSGSCTMNAPCVTTHQNGPVEVFPPVAVAPVAGPVFPPIDDIVVKPATPAPVGTVAVVEAAEVVEHTPTAKPKRKRTVVDTGTDETALQAACRTTWAAYSGAYAIRYGVAPLRNAKVNAAIKGFVQRIGYDESPAVAAYYVANVNDAFVVRNMHDTGLLLKQAEGYRTQWATGRSVTATAARQADQTAANLSVVEEAKLIARARRAAREAARLAGEDFL